MADNPGSDQPAAPGSPPGAPAQGTPGSVPALDGDGDRALSPGATPATYTLLGLLLCAAIFRVGYSLLMKHELGQGAAMFVGLPVLLGTVVALATAPRSPLGMVFKVTAMVLCIIAPLVEEGAICIVMAAPLIFGVIGLVALVIWLLGPKVGRGRVSSCAVLIGLSPLLWEPAEKTPGWEDHRSVDEFADSIDLAAAPEVVWQALSRAPGDLKVAPLPAFMRLRLHAGHREVQGGGLQPGATRDIFFDQDHFVGEVVHSTPLREVVFAVREATPGPGERIGLWLRFVEVRFVLSDLGQGRTRLTQHTRYRRLLDPAVYFAPLERYGVHAMHRYTLGLISHGLSAADAPHG